MVVVLVVIVVIVGGIKSTVTMFCLHIFNASHINASRVSLARSNNRMSTLDVDGNPGVPVLDPWLALLMRDSSLPSTSLPSTANVDGSRTRSRSRSRSRSSKRPLWPTGTSLRQLMEPKAPGPSRADEEIQYSKKRFNASMCQFTATSTKQTQKIPSDRL